jgi:DNA polymerase elongation subunit (family B)
MERYYRKPVDFKKETLEFQGLDWLEFNENENESSGEEPSFYAETEEKYIIRAFGVTENKESVCVNIKNFSNFFYVKVSTGWSKFDTEKFLDDIIDTQVLSKNGNMYYSMKRYAGCIQKKKCITLRKNDFDGFNGNKQYTFLRLVFNNSQAMGACARMINDHNNTKCHIGNIGFKLKVYESNLPSILRLFHLRNIKPSGWISIDNFEVKTIDKKSTCQIEVDVDWKDLNYLDRNTQAPFLQASFDIETMSEDLHSFPIPTNKGDPVITIATTFKYQNDTDFFVKHILTLKDCAEIKESENTPVVVESFNNEIDLLLAWKNLLVKMDPDVIYGYNSDSFDCWYLYKRAELLNCQTKFLEMSRITANPSVMIEKSFSSSGRGTTEFRRLEILGRINFDILIFIKIEYKLISYKLNDVSAEYLKEKKVDMNIKEMFKMFERGTPEDIKLISKYCVQDTCLPQKLVDKLLIMQTQISMSNVTLVPITWLITRGQQIKTFSLLVKSANESDYLVPTKFSSYDTKIYKKLKGIDEDSDDENDDRFTGAVVLPPKKDAYYEPICTLDFKSLYPSIMMAHSLCHSTLVTNDKYLNLPEYKYQTHSWDDLVKDDNKKPILDETGELQYIHHSYTYATPKNTKENEIQGILPRILEKLVNSRQEYKDLMKKAYRENDIELANVYNTSQLAVKVTMNSIYGFLGAHMLPAKKIAATVTALGREMIGNTKDFLETNYMGAEVVYGDSVTGRTPILLRKNGIIFIETIENLGDEWVSYPWFKPFQRGNSHKQYSLSELEVYSRTGWSKIKKVIRHLTNKTIYSVLTKGGYVEVTEDHSLLNKNNEIIKAIDCHTGTQLMTGYPFVSSFKKINDLIGIHTFNIEDQLSASKKYLELKSLGYSISIKMENDIIYLYQNYNNCNDAGRIQIVKVLNKTEQYVYDIETEDGSFQAGIGNIIVKNTDSCFVKFNTDLNIYYTKECARINNLVVITQHDRDYLLELKTKLIQETMELGKKAARETTNSLFTYPISLEYEKINMPCILLSKKRYIMNKYEDYPDKYKETSSGIILNRRDNFKLVKNLYTKIKNILLNMINKESKDKEQIYELINKTINDILDKKIDIAELIITKTYKPTKKTENLPQIALVKKIMKRDPGNAPRYNDKINYVITDTNEITKQPQYLKSESPEYVLEHNLDYDAEYYISYLIKPICELLQFYFDKPEELFKAPLKAHKVQRKLVLQKKLGIEPKVKKITKKVALKKPVVVFLQEPILEPSITKVIKLKNVKKI